MCVSFFEFDSCDNYERLLEWAVWKWTRGWVKNTFTLGWTIPLRERRYFMKSLCFAAAEREKVSNRRKGKWGKTALFIISAYFIGVSLLVAHLTRPTPWLEPVYMIVVIQCGIHHLANRGQPHTVYPWSGHWIIIILRLSIAGSPVGDRGVTLSQFWGHADVAGPGYWSWGMF